MKKWQVIAGMIAYCRNHDNCQPEAGCRGVTFHYRKATNHWQNIAENVLDGVTVHRSHTIGRLIFMMNLVNRFVEKSGVK